MGNCDTMRARLRHFILVLGATGCGPTIHSHPARPDDSPGRRDWSTVEFSQEITQRFQREQESFIDVGNDESFPDKVSVAETDISEMVREKVWPGADGWESICFIVRSECPLDLGIFLD